MYQDAAPLSATPGDTATARSPLTAKTARAEGRAGIIQNPEQEAELWSQSQRKKSLCRGCQSVTGLHCLAHVLHCPLHCLMPQCPSHRIRQDPVTPPGLSLSLRWLYVWPPQKIFHCYCSSQSHLITMLLLLENIDISNMLFTFQIFSNFASSVNLAPNISFFQCGLWLIWKLGPLDPNSVYTCFSQ